MEGSAVRADDLPSRERQLCAELLELLDERYGVKSGPCQIILAFDADNHLQWIRPSPTVHASRLGDDRPK